MIKKAFLWLEVSPISNAFCSGKLFIFRRRLILAPALGAPSKKLELSRIQIFQYESRLTVSGPGVNLYVA